MRRLRRVERSRRLLLLRAIVDQAGKTPELTAPLPPPEAAWDLLARAQQAAPAALDAVLAHPHTGTWAGYTVRLLGGQVSGVWPTWVHIGYVHSLAAAAAIRAGIGFQATVPVAHGEVIVPTLGVAWLFAEQPWSVAEIRGVGGGVEIADSATTVQLPRDLGADAAGWSGIRTLHARTGGLSLSLRLDDVDPYRDHREPGLSRRVDGAEVAAWRELMAQAWALIVTFLPDVAEALRVGLDSVVPKPAARFRATSSSSSDALGSAVLARPRDASVLAAMLVHEFQHNRLDGLAHVVPLWENDPRERFYTAWRDDPRPVGGVVQGVYAFFGMTAFWRALARHTGGLRAAFEFAHNRAITWRAVVDLRGDAALTVAGRRFLDGVAELLGPWQDEAVDLDAAEFARLVAVDHYVGWRIRHVRPDTGFVDDLADAWLAGRAPVRARYDGDRAPTSIPDGGWSRARADLVRLVMDAGGRTQVHRRVGGEPSVFESWTAVPGATRADFAWATGRFTDAVRGYRAELAEAPDRPASLAGLAVALAEVGGGARALVEWPELVRAVHRRVRGRAVRVPSPEDVAEWIGGHVTG